MNILVFPKYGEKGPSSRVRFYQYIPFLEKKGATFHCAPLLGNNYIDALYSGQRFGFFNTLNAYWNRVRKMMKRKNFDLIWMENEALPYVPFLFEDHFYRGTPPVVVNYDDAVFNRYEKHRNTVVRVLTGKKIDRVMAAASVVVAGNPYLAERAKSVGAKRIEILPSVINIDHYSIGKMTEERGSVQLPESSMEACVGLPDQGHFQSEANPSENLSDAEEKLVVGWIGTPSTAHFLEIIRQPLQQFSQTMKLELHVMGIDHFSLKGVHTKSVPWSSKGESSFLKQIDVGMMPLYDEPFERGKCGYKLIQYFASSKPVIASPVGVNKDLVNETNGILAVDEVAWLEALKKMAIFKKEQRLERLGQAGRKMIEKGYSIQSTVDHLWDILRSAGA